MKAEEKQVIFNLLKTADAYNCGYTRECFAQEKVFEDDLEAAPAPQTQAAPAMENAVSNQLNEKPAAEKLTLDTINEKISRCTRCGLARTRHNIVPGMGVANPQVLVIGEGPGYEEDMQGKPFVGKAGILLDKMLNAIQLDRNTNCYIANVVKCRPPENRNPSAEEQAACFGFLEAQIHILKPKMILCMGKVVIEKLMNESIPISVYHGNFYEYNGIPVMPTYHPSALLRNEELKRPAWEDLKRFRAKLNTL